MRTRPTLQTASTGLVVAIVGFFSSFPIILQGLTSVGASQAEAASGLMAAAVAMGIAGIALSVWKREPISVAWSTPGVALLAVTPALADGFGGAVAGFLVAGALTILSGLWKPLGRLATTVPPSLAQALLAGVLVSLCAAPFQALAVTPATALPILLTWFLVSRVYRLFAVPAAVIAAIIVTLIANDGSLALPAQTFSAPVLTGPIFSLDAILQIGLPLYIVTMATQNIPGIAILRSYGYTPPAGPLFAGVGAASVLSAPFGAPATCLAAITAALCAGPDSHPDPRARWWSAVFGGVIYCLFGLFAAVITTIAASAPDMLLETLTGVALISVFINAASAALAEPSEREAAGVTFLVTASGMSFLGLGAAVWGLILGAGVLALSKALKKE
ncbi:benzoate/H(+) symporter BenE family transporter [Paracoccaceae bacterium GXU_MW_L88]